MGIKDLSKVIADNAPGAIKLSEIKNYFGNYCKYYTIITYLIIYVFVFPLQI